MNVPRFDILALLLSPVIRRIRHLEERVMSALDDLNNAVNAVTTAVNDNTTATQAAVAAIQSLQSQIATGGVDPTAAISQLGAIASGLQANNAALNAAVPVPTPAPAPTV